MSESLIKKPWTNQVTRDDSIVRPTIEAYNDLENAFDFFNEALFVRSFDIRLPHVVITMPRGRGYKGYFRHGGWGKANSNSSQASEIGMHPRFLGSEKDACATLGHEQCHLAQDTFPDFFGKPGKRGYHNKAFAKLMISVGLMPSSTGRPGGDITGVKMSHYVIPDGPFDRAYNEFIARGHTIRWHVPYGQEPDTGDVVAPSEEEQLRDKKRRSKTKYSCSTCGLNAWAKPCVKIACVTCSNLMQEVSQ
ncbi:MAG: sprT domain-containing protein [gamma proteobacterium symbiont of Ctena orbiculata]|nr:MAG: sprT domain-containing protein [gamma proteobacterium symbiont of Ctena orbiculata]